MDKNMDVIITAAGAGRRMGLSYNKMLYPLEEHRTVLECAIDSFYTCAYVSKIIVTYAKEDKEAYEKILKQYDSKKVYCIEGGEERSKSVYEAFQHTTAPYICITDGARPYIRKEFLQRLYTHVQQYACSIPVLPVTSTLKHIHEDGYVIETLDRSVYGLAQTPQMFWRTTLEKAYTKVLPSLVQYTDEASICEAIGERVFTFEGDYLAHKLTTPEDIIYVQSFRKKRNELE